jgi:hypothetical protein
VITDRMLKMFKHEPTPVKETPAKEADASGVKK